MFTNELKISRFIPWLLSLVVAAEVVRAGDGDDFQLGTETQIGVQDFPIVLSRVREGGKVFEFRKSSADQFDIVGLSRGDQAITLYSINRNTFYDNSRFADQARMRSVVFNNGELSALLKVGDHWFMIRMSENMPVLDEGLMYFRHKSRLNQWYVRYTVLFINNDYPEIDFDFDWNFALPKLVDVRLAGLDAVRAEITVNGKEKPEIHEYSIVPHKGVPTYRESGAMKLFKNGVETNTFVRGWSPIHDEAEVARSLQESSLPHIRMLVLRVAKDQEEYLSYYSGMRDKGKLAIVRKRVEEAFAEVESKPKDKASEPGSSGR